MTIKFRIIGHEDNTYNIESIDLRYAYRKGFYKLGVKQENLIEALEEIDDICRKAKHKAEFYMA